MNISCIYGLLVHLFNWMHKKYDQHPQLIDTVGHMSMKRRNGKTLHFISHRNNQNTLHINNNIT